MPDETPAALDDVRILDLTGELGAYCTKLLADLGADVIKIEPPGGDPARLIGPFYHDEPGPATSLSFLNLNTSKRSVTLNLEDEAGREAFRKLVPTADIVVEAFPPGYLDSLGLGYDALRALRPDLILTSITGFGGWGAHARYLAPDIVGVAMAGIMWLAGDPQDPPNLPYGAQGYLCASIQAASGTMLALYHRDLTGEGQRVDVSMQEALLIAQETAMQAYDMTKSVRGRTGARVALPFPVPGLGPYEALDGWIWSYVGTPAGAPWSELLKWIEEEGQAEDLTHETHRSVIDQLDLRFLTSLALNREEREKHSPSLARIEEVLKPFFASKGKWELYEEGQRRRLLIGIVSTPEDLGKNPQLNARRWFQEIEHPELGATLRYPGPPYRLSETPWRIARRPPLQGEHTAEVLAEAGYTPEQLAALRSAGGV
jgi:crotonobetainyl-CoA:carnitine CoA-transferase CaiB-like acyl-CoA transferase